MTHQDYKKTVTLNNEFEAQVLESILKERQIPFRVTSYHDTAFDGLYQTQKGWGYISAPEGYGDEIMEVVLELRENAAEASDGEDP